MINIAKLTTVLGATHLNCVVKVQNVHITQDPVGLLTTESKFNMVVHFEVFKSADGMRGEVIDIGAKSIAVAYPLDCDHNAIKFAYMALHKLPLIKKAKDV